jgi:hypothetical protein
MTPAQVGELMEKEHQRPGKIIVRLGIKAEG